MPENTKYKNESKQDFSKRQNSQREKHQVLEQVSRDRQHQEALANVGHRQDAFQDLDKTQTANLQTFLKHYGFYNGKIDSIAGPKTREGYFKYRDSGTSIPAASEGMRGAGYFGKNKEGNPRKPVKNIVDSVMDFFKKK